MKNIFFTINFNNCFFLNNLIKMEWEVVANEKLGKIKTANSIVSEIYSKAVKQHNEVEIIKCFSIAPNSDKCLKKMQI
jgi:hypothetical protein